MTLSQECLKIFLSYLTKNNEIDNINDEDDDNDNDDDDDSDSCDDDDKNGNNNDDDDDDDDDDGSNERPNAQRFDAELNIFWPLTEFFSQFFRQDFFLFVSQERKMCFFLPTKELLAVLGPRLCLILTLPFDKINILTRTNEACLRFHYQKLIVQ